MQTNFSATQLADPATASCETVIRKCVHCGFCTATCPTYVLLGDELDSPRGRIYLMKEMLENQQTPTPDVVKHIDRCLSCLSCMTTCPSGVNYMHLVDHARAYIQDRYKRPVMDRLFRRLLAAVLPYPRRFRAALKLARLAYPALPLIKRINGLKPLVAMLSMAPKHIPPATAAKNSPAAAKRGRVALMQGCAEPVLRPNFRAAAIRLLNRTGFDVIFAPDEACCGALVHHMGREADSLEAARRNVDAWCAVPDLDAIIITASGCGTTIKDYGFMLRNDPVYAEKAARVSALAKDIAEFLDSTGLPAVVPVEASKIAYHSACSMQHGQKITFANRRLHCSNTGQRPSLLWLGRHLQYFTTRHRRPARQSQNRQPRKTSTGCHRDRKYRLHHANQRPHDDPRGPHHRAAGLGNRRATPGEENPALIAAWSRLECHRGHAAKLR
jgi:glycolate oxidase iron-sulfur subunit